MTTQNPGGFFGITQLGAPNPLQAGLVSALGLNVFSDAEFEHAFA